MQKPCLIAAAPELRPPKTSPKCTSRSMNTIITLQKRRQGCDETSVRIFERRGEIASWCHVGVLRDDSDGFVNLAITPPPISSPSSLHTQKFNRLPNP
jgi:hypothetical protein